MNDRSRPLVDLIALDRDDTICVMPEGQRYQYGEDPIVLVAGVVEFIRFWNERNVPVVVATNQQGISLAEFPDMTCETVKMFNDRLQVELGPAKISRFFVCPHSMDMSCQCRKPRPGLINAAILAFSARPGRTWVIGNSSDDIEAGRAAGAHAIQLAINMGQNGPQYTANGFPECLKMILSGRRSHDASETANND